MKKYVGIAGVLVVVIVLFIIIFLCGGSELVCKSTSKQSNYEMETEYTISYSSDIVNKVLIKQTIKSSDKNILKQFKEQLKNQYSFNKKIYGGYDYSVKDGNNKIDLEVTINYDEINMKKYINNNQSMKKYINKDNKLTINKAKALYKTTGATCK